MNFDNLVMKVGKKALAFANKHGTCYSVKKENRKGEREGELQDLPITLLETATADM